MFFVFGSPRSGTTLLAQCLNAHSQVVVPFETDFIVPLAFILERVRDPVLGRELVAGVITGSAGFPASLGEYLEPAEVREIVRTTPYEAPALLARIYERLAAKCGKRLAGDKSPNDLLYLRVLVQTGVVSEHTKIIHLVRDIRDVMVSLNRLGWVNDLDGYFPRMWADTNLYLRTLYDGISANYLLLRYEDLVRAPSAHLRRICDFLGVEFEERIMLSSERHSRYKEMPHHAGLFEAISGAKVGGFRAKLSAEQLRSYETQAHEALARFGYEPGGG